MTDGFYKTEDGINLIYGANFIIARDYELSKELKDTYDFPIDGWYWFDNEEDAQSALENGEFDVCKWHNDECEMRIVAPISLINSYPQLLFDLTVTLKLQIEQFGDNMFIYCNYVESEHQALIDSSNGVIYLENKSK